MSLRTCAKGGDNVARTLTLVFDNTFLFLLSDFMELKLCTPLNAKL